MDILISIILGIILSGLTAWGLNKVYTMTNDKITIAHSLVGIRTEALDAKSASTRCETKINSINTNMCAMEATQKILRLENKEVITKLDRTLVTLNEHQKTINQFGKIIEAVNGRKRTGA